MPPCTARIAGRAPDCFIARALTFVHEPGSDPPHEGMEPQDRLDHHVNRGGQIVAAADVADLMGQHRLSLPRRPLLLQVFDRDGRPMPAFDAIVAAAPQ